MNKILGIILFLFLLVGGYVLLNNESTNNLTSIQVLPSRVPDQPTDPTSGWKSYRNTKYGYEIKYPDNDYVNCTAINSNDFFLFKGTEPKDCGLGEEPTEFYIKQDDTSSEYKKSNECFTVSTKQSYISNSIPAIEYTYTRIGAAGYCAKYNRYDQAAYYEVKRGNQTLTIYVLGKDDPIKNKILSTLQLTQ